MPKKKSSRMSGAKSRGTKAKTSRSPSRGPGAQVSAQEALNRRMGNRGGGKMVSPRAGARVSEAMDNYKKKYPGKSKAHYDKVRQQMVDTESRTSANVRRKAR